MKFEWNKKYTTIALYALLVLLAAMICFEAFSNIGRFFGWLGTIVGYIRPFTNGIVFAFLLNPLLRRIDDRILPKLTKNKWKPVVRRSVAIAITYVITFTIIGLFIALVIPQVITSITNIANNISAYFKAIESLYDRVMGFLNEMTLGQGPETEALLSNIMAKVVETLEGLLERTNEILSTILVSAFTATQKITTGILNIFLGVIVSIYLLMDREKLFAQCKKVLRAILPAKVYGLVSEIALESNRILSGFVVGKVIDSLIIGVLCFVGMSLLNMPYAVLISVIVGVTNVIPYFGPFIGAIPSFIIIAVQSPIKSLWFLIFILLLQQFDGNILGPKILGDSIGLSALWVMFSIIFFSSLMGIAGMFIGVPLFAIIYSLCKRFVSYLLVRKGHSPNTRDYASEKNPLIK